MLNRVVSNFAKCLAKLPKAYFGGGHGHEQLSHQDRVKKIKKEFYWRQDVTLNPNPDPDIVQRDRVVLRNQRSGYYLDPQEVSTRIVKVFGMYDKVQDVGKITLSTQWHELGLDEIDMVNIVVAIEQQFDMEFPDEEIDKWKDVGDIVEYVGKSFHAA